MSDWIVSCYYDTRYVSQIVIHGVIEIELQTHKNHTKVTVRNNSEQHYLFRFPVPGIENPELYPHIECFRRETKALTLPKLRKLRVERKPISISSPIRTARYK